jgi:hypothetical protein
LSPAFNPGKSQFGFGVIKSFPFLMNILKLICHNCTNNVSSESTEIVLQNHRGNNLSLDRRSSFLKVVRKRLMK